MKLVEKALIRGVKLKLGCLVVLLAAASCATDSPERTYLRLEKQELATGVRYDSLFRGLHFGMPYAAFREHCLNMHVSKVLLEGGLKSGAWLESKLQNEMKYPAAINFFPDFKENEISEMHAAIYYESGVSWKQYTITKDTLMRDA